MSRLYWAGKVSRYTGCSFKTVNGKRYVATAHLIGGVLVRFNRGFWKEISNAPIFAKVLEKICHTRFRKVASMLI